MRLISSTAALFLALLSAGCASGLVAETTAPATIPVTDLSSIVPGTPATDPTSRPTEAPEPTDDMPTPSPSPSPTPSMPLATATPTATFADGPPTADCVDGWTRPLAGSDEYEHALEVLSGHMGVAGSWTVTDMRYFTGPEVPFSEPQYDPVERWYVKAALVDDPTFRARWLIERRTELIQGISAVASYDSTGYASPDWTGFVGEGQPVSYLGLPGEWSGIPYDFVTGEGDSGNPGLPDEVAGCLAGT